MDLNEAWQNVLGELEVELSRANFTTWFKDTFIDNYSDENEVIIGVPTNFAKKWLEKKYKSDLKKALGKNLPEVKDITFVIKERRVEENEDKTETQKKNPVIQKSPIPQPTTVKKQLTPAGLNEDYTFKNFVVGESNKLAHAASKAISNSPGTSYNPLFIYGGVGLGKTHLMHAIGNSIKNRDPGKQILYITCETFTNHFIDVVQNGGSKEFKEKYRGLDVMLMDDVQFLGKKEQTQEEFFHTFNALYQDNKQIVLTSDRQPKEIPMLEDRLRSRFESGMIADIGRPDVETRMAIIGKKLDGKGEKLPRKIIEYIAENVHHSNRELEGAVNRLIAHKEFHGEKITLEIAEQVLGEILTENEKRLSPDKVIEEVIDFFEVKKKDLLGKRRFKELVLPRQLTMYLLRHELNLSFPQIADVLNKKDHTTIIHGCEKIEKKLQKDKRLKKEFDIVKEKIYIGG
jgi:chromosomal replication initiator protein